MQKVMMEELNGSTFFIKDDELLETYKDTGKNSSKLKLDLMAMRLKIFTMMKYLK